MPNLDSLTSPVRDLWNRASASLGGSPAITPTAPGPQQSPAPGASYDHTLEHLPDPSIGLPAVLARLDPAAKKLDDFQESTKGPYRVGNSQVLAPAQFRMRGGCNEANAGAGSKDARLLAATAAKAGITDLYALQSGRGDPRSLVKLTQALIDAGQLSGDTKTPAAQQIHDLQWRFGIGLDCAGYVYRALAAVHGDPAKLGLKPSGFENFTGLPTNPHFSRVGPENARPGDVIVLAGNGSIGNPGHNLIVRCQVDDPAKSPVLGENAGRARDFIKVGGANVHAYYVDSSFSAGANGSADGGVRRDLVMYNAQSKEWCTVRSGAHTTVGIDKAPYGEPAVTGVFRAKVTP